jgi:DNA-binding NarL/FixJ family response regulator
MSKRRRYGNRIPVWLVDDNRSFCVVLSETLNESRSVECQKCLHSSRSAIMALARSDSPPSVILLDIKMPKVSGLDSISRLKQLSPATQIIMLTSHDLDENIRTAISRGATGYLLKRSKPPEIIKAIEEAQRGGVPLDSLITGRITKDFLGQTSGHQYHLTRREKDILRRIATGRSSLRVAHDLNLSYYTVDTHLKNIFQKLQVHTRHGLIAKASQERLI